MFITHSQEFIDSTTDFLPKRAPFSALCPFYLDSYQVDIDKEGIPLLRIPGLLLAILRYIQGILL